MAAASAASRASFSEVPVAFARPGAAFPGSTTSARQPPSAVRVVAMRIAWPRCVPPSLPQRQSFRPPHNKHSYRADFTNHGLPVPTRRRSSSAMAAASAAPRASFSEECPLQTSPSAPTCGSTAVACHRGAVKSLA